MNHERASSSDTTKKWLIGCGIGCGVVILILAILGVSGYFFVKNIVQGFQETEDMMSTLVERYGEVEEYCPEPDGRIRPYRMEAFLGARERFAIEQEMLEDSLRILTETSDESEIEVKRPKNVFKMIGLGFGIIPKIAEFIRARNQALLEEDIGIGEYTYIYVITFYSWLGKAPEDGPGVQISGMRMDDRSEHQRDVEEVRELSRDIIIRRLHRQMLSILRNQFAKLEERGYSSMEADWYEALEAEIKAMESDSIRLPWQESLPQRLSASLSPYRGRLEASYSEMTNSLELDLD